MLRHMLWQIVIFSTMVSVCVAATITVRRDGTGEHSILQSALDAAADGDTILIGPGEYTETTTIHPPGWPGDLEVYGEIRQQRLTIIGAGADVTIIGPTVHAPDWNAESPEGLATDAPKDSITISDLTVRNCFKGIALNCSLQMERCHVENNRFGLSWTARGGGGTVRDCRFSTLDALQPLGLYVRGVAGVIFEDCAFVRAEPYVDNAGAVFRRCSSVGPGVEGFYSASGVCQLWDCRVTDVEIGLTTGYMGARCEVYNSEIEGSFAAVLLNQRTGMHVQDSYLSGGTNSVIFARDAEDVSVHGSDLICASGPVIRCTRPAVWGPVTYDLTDNYWGTTSEDQIRDWIIDSNDDPSIAATVLYSPFAGQSVPTEATSWGDLKALFR